MGESMRKTFFSWLLALSAFASCDAIVRADGGLIRLMEQQGRYRLTVFTAPTPMRVGPVDVSVLVQDAVTGDLVPDAAVTIRVAPAGCPEQHVSYLATTAAASNKLFRAAQLEIPQTGRWEIRVMVTDGLGKVECQFDVEVAERSGWGNDLPLWIGWPAVAVLLFAVHQFLVSKRPAPKVNH